MKAISADSHAVEGPDVFTSLADRFGDNAPRVISSEGRGDNIVIPLRRDGSVNLGHMALLEEVLGEMFEWLSDSARRKITRDNVRALYSL